MRSQAIVFLRPCSAAIRPRGFALIVTTSMLMLLALVAVGMLTLAGVTLRTSAQGSAQSVAHANARMALMLALGELQKTAGPDQRVTARADILDDDIANPRLTGAWKSWEIRANSPPQASDYEKNARDSKFLGWLVSSPQPNANGKVEFAHQGVTNPVTLWGPGTLGDKAPGADLVTAAEVNVGGRKGSFAWAVMDEGVKVRVNTPYHEESSSQGMLTNRLGSGVRPNTGAIPLLAGLDRPMFLAGSKEFKTVEKGITRLDFGLAAEELANGMREPLKELFHDVTTLSAGVLSDVAAGGLKEDFNLLANSASLPAPYAGKGVYTSRLGITGPSDPRWESLHELAGLYKNGAELSKHEGAPMLRAGTPARWTAARGSNPENGEPGVANLAPPPGLVLMPSIAKVQVVFSLLTRDIYNYPKIRDTTPKVAGRESEEVKAELHDPWGRNFAGSSYDYLLHLLYTPVVTIHNPYNVILEFSELKVVFGNVPFALQVIRNGEPQTHEPAPLDTMFYRESETGDRHKRFGMTLKTNSGSMTSPRPGSAVFRMLPGEVMMFSPYIDPNRTWKDEYSNRTFSDWDSGSGNTRTLFIDGLPGWRGDGLGFDLDWFCPVWQGLRVNSFEIENGRKYDRRGVIGARASDNFQVKFAPLSVEKLSKNKFTIEIFAKTPGSRSQVSSGIIEMDYETPTGLQDSLLGRDGTITYPKNGTINTMAMHSHSLTRIKDIATVKPFAIISAQAKTTMGGMLADGEDGAYATKPWCFGHGVVAANSAKLLTDHAANQSHALSLQRLDNGTNNLLQFDPETGRGNFITGQTGNTGIKFGAIYDIPLAPLQNFGQLNSANPGGSSGYLPRFAIPIGNSWAHPMLDPGSLTAEHGGGLLLDHSFLLNLALYDHFYFSGLADRTGTFGSSVDTLKQVAARYSDGEPLSDPRLRLQVPAGRTRTDLPDEAAAGDAYKRIASWQMVDGAFNINSTSVPAWKAMLGSIHDAGALYSKIDKSSGRTSLNELPATDISSHETRISRFRLPADLSPADGGEPRESFWLGPREYSDTDLQKLAEEIVGQVRSRGPFLSMAEFVNRRLGSGDTAQCGALQQAIDNAKLNEEAADSANAGFDITSDDVADYHYQNIKAGTGPSHQGAPGFLTQADVLGVLGNAATARSDTFTIRACGRAVDGAGKAAATAYCEAVVQRTPEFVDPADPPETPAADLMAMNKSFGRRFQILSFRWLAAGEI